MRITLSSICAGLLSLGMVGCEPHPAPQPTVPLSSTDMTLRTYKLPPGHGPKIRPILSNLLKNGDQQVGRTALAPDDRLVVLAPDSIHRGIEVFLKDLNASSTPLKPPPTVALTHWLVVAAPGPSPDESCGPKGLQCLRGGPEVVKAVEAVDKSNGAGSGPMHYTLLEQLSIRSMDSEHAELDGATAHIKQRATVEGGKIVADLNVRVMRRNAAGIETRLQFSPNQTVILGQVAFDPEAAHPPAGGDGQSGERARGEKAKRVDDEPRGMLLFITRGKVEE